MAKTKVKDKGVMLNMEYFGAILEDMNSKLDFLVEKVSAHDERFERMDRRFDRIELRLDRIELRLEGKAEEADLIKLDSRVSTLEGYHA